MSAKDDLKIFQNIIAQSPDGLGDPNLIGKFSKAKSMLYQFDSASAMQSQAVAAPMTSAPMGAPQEPLGATGMPNQPQMEGQGALNLP
jgi:hypothetical protein